MAGSRNDTHYSSGYNLLPTDAAAISLMQMETTGIQIINVDGPPNGSEAANPGSIACDRTNGNLWKKQSGTGNTGWEQIASGTDVATQYTTDSGIAVAVSNNINLLGQNLAGSGIQTTASGATVTHRMLSPYSLAGFSFTGGNVDVTRSASGATVTLTSENTSDTASSAALIVAKVAGASSGDAYHRFTIVGGQIWSQGLDNSDSDAFVIASTSVLGTGNVIRASTSGEITMPLQPSFLGIANAQANVVGLSATTYTVIFTNQVVDRGGDFDGTTFTFPVTGLYQMNVTISMSGLAVTNTSGAINLVTTARSYPLANLNWGAVMNASNVVIISGSVLVDAVAGNTATVTVNIAGLADVVTIDAGSTFSGKLEA